MLVVSSDEHMSSGDVGGQVVIQQCLFSAAVSDRQWSFYLSPRVGLNRGVFPKRERAFRSPLVFLRLRVEGVEALQRDSILDRWGAQVATETGN